MFTVSANVPIYGIFEYKCMYTLLPTFRARILKHLLEAEKSTFHEELSFQRSQSTTGLKQGRVSVC